MKRYLSLKFLLAAALGAGVISIAAILSKYDTGEESTTYGEPDGHESDGDVSSFVD
jgi:hypothetical protein